MRRQRLLKARLAFAVAALLCGCAWQADPSDSVGVSASGFIEGCDYQIASPLGAKISEVRVAQGDTVSEGDALIVLESAELKAAWEQARTGVTAAQAALSRLDDRPAEVDIAAAQAGALAAEAALEAAIASKDLLVASYEPFDPPDPDMHSAESAIEIARADVHLASAVLKQVQEGASQEERDVAEANLAEAWAGMHLADYYLQRLTLTAPITGSVAQVLAKRGEIAVPGAPLLELRDSECLVLTVFVSVTSIAGISTGDLVWVTVDAYPQVIFHGEVGRIADQAQFTPANVQTQEERVKLVFAVEVNLEDPLGYLLPGMPADAQFRGNVAD